MGKRTLFTDRTTIGGSPVVDLSGSMVKHDTNKVMQAIGSVSTSTGTATVELEGSFNQTDWSALGLATLTLGTTVTAAKVANNESWPYYRANLKTISGTGAKVSVFFGD